MPLLVNYLAFDSSMGFVVKEVAFSSDETFLEAFRTSLSRISDGEAFVSVRRVAIDAPLDN